MPATQKELDIFTGRLKDLMEENRYNQKELCELCGINESTFSYYKRGVRLPKSDDLANIATALHTTTDYLLGKDQKIPQFAEIKTLLTRSSMEMSQEQIVELSGILLFANQRLEAAKKCYQKGDDMK